MNKWIVYLAAKAMTHIFKFKPLGLSTNEYELLIFTYSSTASEVISPQSSVKFYWVTWHLKFYCIYIPVFYHIHSC